MFQIKLWTLLCLCHFSSQISTPKDATYKAAVVDYNCDRSDSDNLRLFTEVVQEAASQGADIVSFPEGCRSLSMEVEVPIGLLKRCPAPVDCPDKFNKVLVIFSKAARENNIYVLVNFKEYLDCSTWRKDEICPGNGEYSFNTNIVIDRNGAVIERAAQYHLHGEPELTEEVYPYVSSFKTDFGVEFGTVIGFDVFFQKPTGMLVVSKNLTNIIMPARWYSELPFLTSIETQRAFSNGYNINLLAAGTNFWKYGNAGSGIYSGEAGALISSMQEISTYRLLVATVPKIPGLDTTVSSGPSEVDPSELDDLPTFTDPSLDKFLLSDPLVPGYQNITQVYRDITCTIIANVTMGNDEEQYYRYRAAVFSGVRDFGFKYTVGARACAVIACIGDDVYSCGKRFPQYNADAFASFSKLTVIGVAPKRNYVPTMKLYDSTFFSTSLTSSLLSVEPKDQEYIQKTKGKKTTHTLSLMNEDYELYTFGFWGRKFADDGKPVTTPRIENIIGTDME